LDETTDPAEEYQQAWERHNARVAARDRARSALVALTTIGVAAYYVPFVAIPSAGLAWGLTLGLATFVLIGFFLGLFVAVLLGDGVVWIARRILGHPDRGAYVDEWNGHMRGWW
jgi:VIT1/CCC1 family predicted Fe2+/Mn2+ transporter